MKNLFNNSASIVLTIFFALMLTACGGNSENETQTVQESDAMQTESDTESMTAPEQKLNINTAGEEAFRTIPNVGDKMVHEFEEYRPYVSISQFRKEIGKYVDEDQVAAYEEYIFVPIHRNDSDAATLMQIPGLNENEANTLIENRPYNSNQAFSDALSEFISNEQMTTAKKYMKANK